MRLAYRGRAASLLAPSVGLSRYTGGTYAQAHDRAAAAANAVKRYSADEYEPALARAMAATPMAADDDGLDRSTVQQLKTTAKELGLLLTGTKADLVARLRAHHAQTRALLQTTPRPPDEPTRDASSSQQYDDEVLDEGVWFFASPSCDSFTRRGDESVA